MSENGWMMLILGVFTSPVKTFTERKVRLKFEFSLSEIYRKFI